MSEPHPHHCDVTIIGGGAAGLAAALQLARSRRSVVVIDELPDIPGVAEHWGRSVLHCPYCHGWKVRDQAIVVIATGPLATHQALLFRQLSDRVTVVVHDGPGPDVEDRARLAARGVTVEHGPVAAVEPDGDAVRAVRLADGRTIEADAVVVAPRFTARTELLAGVGIEPVPAPMGTGTMVETDERGETTVAGLYAAGNVADVSAQVLQAAAQGSRIGAMINADLVQEDVARAAAELGGDDAAAWDARYVGRGARMWSGHPNGALVDEVGSLEPGRALDVGCGEGADAVWLAQRGWDVVAVDISHVAIDRAAQVASDAGVAVDWRAVDLAVEPPEPGAYDLVSLQYPALRHDAGGHVIRSIVDAVGPGGTLLVVGHAFDHAGGHHHPHFDPADYVQPPDVAALLGAGWEIEVDEVRPRSMVEGRQGPDVADVVLRARRAG